MRKMEKNGKNEKTGRMRILAFSDLHDEEDAFERLKAVYSDPISSGSIPSDSKFDAVFVLGDTTNGSYTFLESVVSSFKNCFFIPGNNESEEVVDRASKLDGYLHGKTAKLGAFSVAGFGMSPPTPFNTHGEISEEEMYVGLSRLSVASNTILLTHCPPRGVFDEVDQGRGHAGSSAILKFINEKKPFAHFCGHIHEHGGINKVGETHVIKVPAAKDYRYCVAEIDNRTRKVDAEFFSL